jgi:hypothetical protein
MYPHIAREGKSQFRKTDLIEWEIAENQGYVFDYADTH